MINLMPKLILKESENTFRLRIYADSESVSRNKIK